MYSWDDSLLVGVALVDEQHHELVDKLDEFAVACGHGEGKQEVGEALKFSVSYIKAHFKDEEELQALYAYPDIEAHKKLHAKFIQNAIDLVQKLKNNGPSAELADEVRKTLVGWFLTHIRTEDKKLSSHIHQSEGK